MHFFEGVQGVQKLAQENLHFFATGLFGPCVHIGWNQVNFDWFLVGPVIMLYQQLGGSPMRAGGAIAPPGCL
jgi:hypothetical protein